jgi:hypothetical protein
VKLIDAAYVTVRDLEIMRGARWGLLATTSHDHTARNSNVSGPAKTVSGLTLHDLDVHDVGGSTLNRKTTGLVVIMPGSPATTFDHVLIDHVRAHDTTMWAGIEVYGESLEGDPLWKTHAQDESLRSTNIVIRNSVVHDTYGDGIVTFMGSGVWMEHNLVYRSGQQPKAATIGTPNALWTWASNDVIVEHNEAFLNNSPGLDGGAFDIDYWSRNTTVQYNYAHDNAAYCVAIFGADKSWTRDAVVRYNVCANNGLESPREGSEELFFGSWDRGTIDNVQVYNNTIYTTRAGAVGASHRLGGPVFAPGTLIFKNNLVVSTVPDVLGAGMSSVPFDRDYNLYYYTRGTFNSGEAHAIDGRDPLVHILGCHRRGAPTRCWSLADGSPAIDAGTRISGAPSEDFAGGPEPAGSTPDIGAFEAPQADREVRATPAPGRRLGR